MLTVNQAHTLGSKRALPDKFVHAGAALLAVVALAGWLQALGRPLLCPCGTVRLWAPSHDSQHLADWYSLLHLSFGLGLHVLVTRFQPGWPVTLKAAVAIVGSVVWEAIENLPTVIAAFNPPGGDRTYSGDTILNAMGDTMFVLAGCLLAARLPRRAVLLTAIVIEVAIWLAIRDGILIGSIRLALG